MDLHSRIRQKVMINKILVGVAILSLGLSCGENVSYESPFEDFRLEGSIDENQLETGEWSFYNLKNGELAQKGNFEAGIRNGTWKYNDSGTDSIIWRCWSSEDSIFKTNLPLDFQVAFEVRDSVSIKSSSSLRTCSLQLSRTVISDYDTSLLTKAPFNTAGELPNSFGWQYFDIKTVCKDTYQIHRISFVDDSGVTVVWWRVSNFNADTLTSINLRTVAKDEAYAKIVLFSIMDNLFVQKLRFFDQYIDCPRIIEVTEKSFFTIGCNKR